jgi:hypothetical protein
MSMVSHCKGGYCQHFTCCLLYTFHFLSAIIRMVIVGFAGVVLYLQHFQARHSGGLRK